MKKTLSLLTIVALMFSATASYAKDVTLNTSGGYDFTPELEMVLAPGATLINTLTGNVVVYNLNAAPQVEPPFDMTRGLIYWDINLNNKYHDPITLGALSPTATDTTVKVTEGDTVVLDFTRNMNLAGPTEAEYMVLMFPGNDFADWYSSNKVEIVGRFTNGDYTAYVIDDTSYPSGSSTASTYGGLVFFNNSVATDVLNAEVDPSTITPAPSTPSVPEPTTATLSLLALAGLAARRRRV